MNVWSEFLLVLLLALSASVIGFALARRAVRLFPTISSSWADRIFLLMALAYIVIFGAMSIVRYLTFNTGYLDNSTAWDLAQYGQLVWNSLNGRLLEGTFILDADTFLGKSFAPILLVFVPLYTVWASPLVLLVTQTVALGVGGFPVYWFARQRLGGGLALLFGLAYFLSPGLENIGLTEFHEIALATPLLAYATYFLLREHYRGLLVCLALALLVKEEIAFIAAIFGVYVFVFQRKRALGLALALFGVGWAAVLLQYLIPFFRGPGHGDAFYYFGEGVIGGGGTRYGYLGHSLAEIATNFVAQPDLVWQVVVIPDKIEYVLHLLVPLAFLPLAGLDVFLLALPTFGYSLLSTYGLQYSIRSYYFAPLLPFLFFAAIVGAQRLLARGTPTWRNAMTALLFVAVVASYFLQAPGPFATYFQSWRYELNEHTVLGNRLAGEIPSEALLVAQNEMLADVSNRRALYEIPIPDYRQVDYLFADTTRRWYNVHRGIWEDRLTSGFFEIVTQQDGYIIAKRRAPAQEVTLRFGDVTLRGYTIVFGNAKPWGMTLRPILEWQADQPVMERYSIAARVWDLQGHLWSEEDREPQEGALPTTQWQPGKPVDDQYNIPLPPTMPPGEYQITVRVRDARTGDAVGDEQVISRIVLGKNKSSFTASDLRAQLLLEQPYYVDMGELRLIGYKPISKEVAAGQALSVGIFWRAREKPRGDYAVAVQLRDTSGRVAFEQSARPANNIYPTTQLDAGEVLLDWHDFVLPNDLAVGRYEIAVVLRDGANNTTLGETLLSSISVVN